MGVQLRDAVQGEGATIDRVTPGMPAEKAGLQTGDVVVECDSIPITARQALGDALFGRNPGENVKLMVKRGGKLEEVHVTLAPDPTPPEDSRPGDRATMFRKPLYRLAVIGVEFPDVKHNDKIAIKNWEESFFSIGTYNTTSATSQPVYGSVNDYYHEDSAGAFRIEGKMFDWVAVAKNRADYSQGTGDPLKMRAEALDILLKREGNDALQDFDGVAFIYAGTRVPTSRGGLFWPHKGALQYGRRRLNYLIVNEGGQKMTDISVFCHEFGHMLGLPDLYARPENPGSEGLGTWCLMSNQLPNGRPQHMSAWCKEQLGWLKPAIIDPTVPQKLVLSPVEGASDQCFKVLVRSDGSEYFLLENRRKTGFDAQLSGEGLLIWRIVEGRPFLQEGHGIEGPAGPRSFLWEVPFPSISNNSFTPFTTPSSHSQLGGGMPVFITGIERLPDGRITFAIGYQYF
jgi:M6 family metalloprotease-like protein